MLPTFIQILQGKEVSLYSDGLKIIKYLTPFLCFIYFREVFLQNSKTTINKLFLFVKFSYVVVVANVLLKFIGLGFPLYRGGIGSKGYIYAGNEISTVFLILYAILGYRLLEQNKKISFWLFFGFTVNIAFVLGSKSAILGIVLMTLIMKIRLRAILSSFKKTVTFLIAGTIIIPIGIFWFVNRFMSSDLFQNRILYYYNKVDILTLLLSSRNLYLEKTYNTFKKEYNLIEKFFGIGQSKYEEMVEDTIEIDFLDFFFAYGIVGLIIFLVVMFLTFQLLKKRKDFSEHPYARLAYVSFLLLITISSLAGHVFSSGIAGIFIGFVFSLTYLKRSV